MTLLYGLHFHLIYPIYFFSVINDTIFYIKLSYCLRRHRVMCPSGATYQLVDCCGSELTLSKRRKKKRVGLVIKNTFVCSLEMMNQLSTNINIGPLIYVSRIETARNTDFAM